MRETTTIPGPADKVVAEFTDGLHRIVPEQLVGIYLTGSLPLRDYCPNKSDIDFIVLCQALPERSAAAQLRRIHRSIARKYPRALLSGSYLAAGSIRTGNPESILALTWHEGALRRQALPMAQVSLFELKTNAITLFGPNAASLPITLSPDELIAFLHGNINSYWAGWIAQHASPFRRQILLWLLPRLTEWAVLGVARQWCTLHTQKIVSKTAAGQYCLNRVPEKFRPVIMQAIETRQDKRVYPVLGKFAIRPSRTRMQQTVAFVRYMIDRFNREYGGLYPV